jgi:hypothetical protein
MSLPDLTRRLALLEITPETNLVLEPFRLKLNSALDGIVHRFYRHLQSHPEGQRFFPDNSRIPALVEKQRAHWQRLFNCQFDAAYLEGCTAIGQAHLRAGIAPYLYIAGYTYFLVELQKFAALHFSNPQELGTILAAATRLVHLDMDLALSVYTREVVQLVASRAAHQQ